MSLVLFAVLGRSVVESAVLGGGVFLILILGHGYIRDRSLVRSLLSEVDEDRRTTDTALQHVERLESRFRAFETAGSREAGDQTAVEIATLGALIKDLAEAVAGQEARLANLAALAMRPVPPLAPAAVPAHPAAPAAAQEAFAPAEPIAAPQQAAFYREAPASATESMPSPARGPAPAPTVEIREAVAHPPVALPADEEETVLAPSAAPPPDVVEAIERGRSEIYLQPIVSLPQRKVRLYEASTMLRTQEGRILSRAEYGPVAAAIGRAAQLDGMLILRSVQIARRLSAKNRELVVACPLSAASLRLGAFLDQVAELVRSSPGLGNQIAVFFGQAEFDALAPKDFEALKPLLSAGCRLGIDRVQDLRLDARTLGARGVRFVKVSATLLLGAGAGTEIHLADLSGLMSRFGVDLIADEIEAEATVADLLDYDLKFAQGPLFSPPRPVRADVLSDEPVPSPAAAPAPAEQAPPARTAARPVAAAAPAPVPPPRQPPAIPVEPRLALVAGNQNQPETLGQGALHEAIDKLRKVQEEKTQEPAPPERRSAWRMLARRVGAREQG